MPYDLMAYPTLHLKTDPAPGFPACSSILAQDNVLGHALSSQADSWLDTKSLLIEELDWIRIWHPKHLWAHGAGGMEVGKTSRQPGGIFNSLDPLA